MASVIRAIYTALKNQAVSVGSVTPTAYDLTELPNAIDTAKLPARLLLPFGANAEQAHEFTYATFGAGSGNADVIWHLFDLLLWRSAPSGTTLADLAADLVTYAGKYVDMAQVNRHLVDKCAIEAVRQTFGVWEYPASSGHFFYGVYCAVDVRELL